MLVDEPVSKAIVGSVEIDVPAVLLNISRQYERGITAAHLYERTRGYWVMRPDKHEGVKYAMAVANRIIREVYLIDSWDRSPVDEIVVSDLRRFDTIQSRSKFRCTFTGVVATDIRDRFVGRSVPSAQNPVRWINC